MQKKAQQWAFGKDKKVKAGNGTRNYLHEEGGTNTPGAEATQDQMQKKASIWPPKESAKKSSSSKAKSRLWPKTSSAQTAQTANIKGAGRT